VNEYLSQLSSHDTIQYMIIRSTYISPDMLLATGLIYTVNSNGLKAWNYHASCASIGCSNRSANEHPLLQMP